MNLRAPISYPASMRIEALAASRGVALHWRPFLLGPIFAAQGHADSPFNLNPPRGATCGATSSESAPRSVCRCAASDPFPQNSLLAARVALALDADRRPEFSRAVYTAEFGGGPVDRRARGESPAIFRKRWALNAGEVLDRAASAPIKDQLRAETRRKPRNLRRAKSS